LSEAAVSDAMLRLMKLGHVNQAMYSNPFRRAVPPDETETE
jgi:hypothetical protein